MDIDAVADELYDGSRADFVRTRDTRAKQARADGDRELADQIRELRKPTVGGWLTNQLVRTHRAEVESLAELGAQFRDAHKELAGERLRELTRRRAELLGALISLVHELGYPVSADAERDVEVSLRAAIADPAAAETLLRARLTAPIDGGDADLWLTAGGSGPAKPARPGTQPRKRADAPARREEQPGRTTRRKQETTSRRTEARASLRDAVAARDAARSKVIDADHAAKTTADTAADLQQRLDEATRAAREARAGVVAARKERDAAERAVERAEQRLADLE